MSVASPLHDQPRSRQGVWCAICSSLHLRQLAFETTPKIDEGLREVVVKTFNDHHGLMDYEEIQSLLDSGIGLAWRLVQVLLRDPDAKNDVW